MNTRHDSPDRRSFLRIALAATAAGAVSPLAGAPAWAADFTQPAAGAAGLTSYLKDDSLLLRYDNLPLLAYRAQPSLKYPYFCPLPGPASGLSVTTESALPYPHHRGLWLGCDPLAGGNYWADNGLESGQIISTSLKLDSEAATENSVGFTQSCEWKREGSHPFSDKRRYTVTRDGDTRLFVDCDFEITANEDISIKNAKHSFFAMRAAADISPSYGGTLLNSHGGEGAAGSYGKTADWCCYFGKRRRRPDVVEGIAILDHPENFGGDCPWFTRDYGHLSPSPFNFLEEPWTLASGEKLTLRYRVVLFAGSPKEAGLNAVYKQWTA